LTSQKQWVYWVKPGIFKKAQLDGFGVFTNFKQPE